MISNSGFIKGYKINQNILDRPDNDAILCVF